MASVKPPTYANRDDVVFLDDVSYGEVHCNSTELRDPSRVLVVDRSGQIHIYVVLWKEPNSENIHITHSTMCGCNPSTVVV